MNNSYIPDDKDKTKNGAAGDAATASQPTQQAVPPVESARQSSGLAAWRDKFFSSFSPEDRVGGVRNQSEAVGGGLLPSEAVGGRRGALASATTTSGLHSYRPNRNPNDALQDDTFTAEELGLSVPAQKNAPANGGGASSSSSSGGGRRPSENVGDAALTDADLKDAASGEKWLSRVNALRNDDGTLNMDSPAVRATLAAEAYPASDDAGGTAVVSGRGNEDKSHDDTKPVYDGKDIEDLLAFLEPYYERRIEQGRPETKAERKKRERREKWERAISGIADVGRALSNLYFTSQYAPDMYTDSSSMSDAARAHIERAKKEREEREANGLNAAYTWYTLKKGERDYQRQLAKDAQTQQNWVLKFLDDKGRKDKLAELTGQYYTSRNEGVALDNDKKKAEKDKRDKNNALNERVAAGDFNIKDKDGKPTGKFDFEAFVREYAKINGEADAADLRKKYNAAENEGEKTALIQSQTNRNNAAAGASKASELRIKANIVNDKILTNARVGAYNRSGRGGGGGRGGRGGSSSSKDYNYSATNTKTGSKFTLYDFEDKVKWDKFYRVSKADVNNRYPVLWKNIPTGMKKALRNGSDAFKSYCKDVLLKSNDDYFLNLLVDKYNSFNY